MKRYLNCQLCKILHNHSLNKKANYKTHLGLVLKEV